VDSAWTPLVHNSRYSAVGWGLGRGVELDLIMFTFIFFQKTNKSCLENILTEEEKHLELYFLNGKL
jgi:hypothetical protein